MEEQYQAYAKNQFKLIIHYVLLFLLAFTFMSFAGCGSDNSTSNENPQNPNPNDPQETQGPNDVWLVGSSFNVANLEVSAGTTVTWTNKSNMEHTVTSGTRGADGAGDLFDRSLSPGQSFSFTFEDAGSIQYFCRIHGGMSAEVTVTE